MMPSMYKRKLYRRHQESLIEFRARQFWTWRRTIGTVVALVLLYAYLRA